MNTNDKSHELSKKLTTHIEELARATDAARMSAEMLRYLDMCARFHRYSPYNIFLILLACPEATHVAGFHKWRSMDRFVHKGEKGIPILAPVLVRDENGEDEEAKKLVGFKVVYVFDVSQTDGEPLPEPPNWKSSERDAMLQEQLTRFAKSKGIAIEVRELAGDIQGVSLKGSILLSEDAGTKTLIHELAHELMHQGKERMRDRTLIELEAESVAYVVARHFGLGGLASPNYVALHGADAELILAHLERIRKTATEIITAIHKQEVDSMPV